MVVDKNKSVLLRWELKFFSCKFCVEKITLLFSALSRGHAKKEGIPGNKSAQNLIVGEFL